MQRYKDRKVTVHNKIINRHVYVTDQGERKVTLPSTVIRINKTWHQVFKALPGAGFDYMAGRELTFMEQRILEEDLREFKIYGENDD